MNQEKKHNKVDNILHFIFFNYHIYNMYVQTVNMKIINDKIMDIMKL